MASYVGDKFGQQDVDKLVSILLDIFKQKLGINTAYPENDFFGTAVLCCRKSLRSESIQTIRGRKLSWMK